MITCECCGHVFDPKLNIDWKGWKGYIQCPSCDSYLEEDGSQSEDN